MSEQDFPGWDLYDVNIYIGMVHTTLSIGHIFETIFMIKSKRAASGQYSHICDQEADTTRLQRLARVRRWNVRNYTVPKYVRSSSSSTISKGKKALWFFLLGDWAQLEIKTQTTMGSRTSLATNPNPEWFSLRLFIVRTAKSWGKELGVPWVGPQEEHGHHVLLEAVFWPVSWV